jgi:cytochrome P450
MITRPPGPPPTVFRQLVYRPGRDPLVFFADLARKYGDFVHLRMGGERLYLVSDPRAIKEVLVANNASFAKGRGLERAKRLLGQGLLTSEGPLHRRQRRLMQPFFHRERIEGYGRTMVQHAEALADSWRPGTVIDVAAEMKALTLSIVGKTLFDVDIADKAGEIGRALTGVLESFWLTMLPFSRVLERLPIPQLRRSRAARARLDAIIFELIAARRESGRDHGDLLSMLLLARDEETGSRNGMSDQQVRDEAMTLLLAGHETTANALAWTWYLLSGAPEVQAQLLDEVDRVLEGRQPDVTDIPRLPFAEQVVTEAMRLFPPAWIIGRRALVDTTVGAYPLPARSIVVMSPWIVHRDARLYDEPERFRPDRWTPFFKSSLPACGYLPFGAGPRRCIGESFAWMELVLIVASLAKRWTLRLIEGQRVEPQALVTLRPRHGLKMALAARTGTRRNERPGVLS